MDKSYVIIGGKQYNALPIYNIPSFIGSDVVFKNYKRDSVTVRVDAPYSEIRPKVVDNMDWEARHIINEGEEDEQITIIDYKEEGYNVVCMVGDMDDNTTIIIMGKYNNEELQQQLIDDILGA